MLKMRRCTLDMLGIPEHSSFTVMMSMTTVVLIIMNMKSGFQYVMSLRTLPFLSLTREKQECQRQRRL